MFGRVAKAESVAAINDPELTRSFRPLPRKHQILRNQDSYPSGFISASSYSEEIDHLQQQGVVLEPVGSGSRQESGLNRKQMSKNRFRKENWLDLESGTQVDAADKRELVQFSALPRLQANQAVEKQAFDLIRYGQSLARRRAFLAARSEFVRALFLVTNSYDSKNGSNVYSNRLSHALIALDEGGQLMRGRMRATNQEQLQQQIADHQIHLISEQQASTISQQQAIDVYCGFAELQIGQAVGRSKSASEALYSLGKLESQISKGSVSDQTANIQSIVFYRAALAANAANAKCANDLGAQLFAMGHHTEAKKALEASLKSFESAVAWKNLAALHQELAVAAHSKSERDRLLRLANLANSKSKVLNRNEKFNDTHWSSANEFQNRAAFPGTGVQSLTSRPAAMPSEQRSAKLIDKVKGWF